jgi:hypothetical protein
VVSVGPVAAAGLAELPFPSRVRSSHLAEQNQVILLWKARNVVKGEWESELEVPSKLDVSIAGAG